MEVGSSAASLAGLSLVLSQEAGAWGTSLTWPHGDLLPGVAVPEGLMPEGPAWSLHSPKTCWRLCPRWDTTWHRGWDVRREQGEIQSDLVTTSCDCRGAVCQGLRMGEIGEVQLAAVPGLTWLQGDSYANDLMPFQKYFPGQSLQANC